MSPSEVVNTAVTSSSNNLTEEEASRYDRQMRLWGLEAQQRFARYGRVVVPLLTRT